MAKAAKQGATTSAAPSKKAGAGKASPKKFSDKGIPKASGRKAEKKTGAKKAAPKKALLRKSVLSLPTLPVSPPAAEGRADVLDRLFDVVMSRRDADPALSHSARLLARGRHKIAQKFGEEAVECLIEAVAGNPRALIGESADVLYHLVVMWVDIGIRPQDVWAELVRREGTSGIAEKAARPRDALSDAD